MTGRNEAAVAVELWPRVALDPSVRVFTAAAGQHAVAEVVIVGDGSGPRAAVKVATGTAATGTAVTGVSGAELAALVETIAGLARAEGARRVTLAAGADLRLRYYARAVGFAGPLRSDLVLERQQRDRMAATGAGPPPRTVLPPFTRVDAVVAHEYWHQIEFGFESGRYRDSVEFRRAVGRYFGVETLEHAIKGNRADAPPNWQAARARLAEEVSAYATTAPKEATAELFTQWWCTAAAPPPSAQYFGSVLAPFFPTADLRHEPGTSAR